MACIWAVVTIAVSWSMGLPSRFAVRYAKVAPKVLEREILDQAILEREVLEREVLEREVLDQEILDQEILERGARQPATGSRQRW